MKDNIEVLGIRLDCPTAKEAMLRTMQFMENDSVDTIEILSMNILMNGREDADWKERVKEIDLVLPGEIEILKAADITDRVRLKDTENKTFLRLLLKYLQKNQKRVFLLAQTEEDQKHAEEAVYRYDRGIRLTGSRILYEGDNKEENVVNEINGTETDCILSVLSSPYQEEFISRNKSLLDAKLWLGCGDIFSSSYNGRMPEERVKRFFRKLLFSWRAGKRN